MAKLLLLSILMVSVFAGASFGQNPIAEVSSNSLVEHIRNYALKNKLDKKDVVYIFNAEIHDSSFAYMSACPFIHFFQNNIPYTYAKVDSYAVCFFNSSKLLTTPSKETKLNFYKFLINVTGNNRFEKLLGLQEEKIPPEGGSDFEIWKLLIEGREAYRVKGSKSFNQPPDSHYDIILQKYFD